MDKLTRLIRYNGAKLIIKEEEGRISARLNFKSVAVITVYADSIPQAISQLTEHHILSSLFKR